MWGLPRNLILLTGASCTRLSATKSPGGVKLITGAKMGCVFSIHQWSKEEERDFAIIRRGWFHRISSFLQPTSIWHMHLIRYQ